MKYMEMAFEIAEELAKVLIHNKYLLDNEEELALVIGARYGIPMEETFIEGIKTGKASIIVNDLTPLNTPIPEGITWN